MGGMGSGEGGLFLRFRLVYILILSLLLSLVSLEKFVLWVVVGGGGGVQTYSSVQLKPKPR